MTRTTGGPGALAVLHELVEWALTARWQDFPREVKDLARSLTIDCVGCALGGVRTAKGRAALAAARDHPRSPGVSVPGLHRTAEPWSASLAWGELVNALEFDADLTPCHVSPFVFPASWVSGECADLPGRSVLESVVIGHEVTARLAGRMPGLRVLGGSAARPTYRFRPRWSAYNTGIVGSVLSHVRLRGGDAAEAYRALGIAAGLCPVPLSSRFFLTPRPTDGKYGLPGGVSLAARVSVDLAFAGYGGDEAALLGPNGLLAILGNGPTDLTDLGTDLGRTWRIRDTVFKRFPTGGVGHVGLDLFERFLRETRTPPEEIEEVTVTSDPIVAVPVLANRTVTNGPDAQFSLAWGFAALPYYPPGPAWQSPTALADPRVRQLFSKVKVRADRAVVRDLYRQLVTERQPYVRRRPTRVTVRTRHGTWSEADDIATGYPERPMSPAELKAKFLRNAEGLLPAASARELFSRLSALPSSRGLRPVGRLLRVRARYGAAA
jgi:2-methylcitrate dehydratase PrpD